MPSQNITSKLVCSTINCLDDVLKVAYATLSLGLGLSKCKLHNNASVKVTMRAEEDTHQTSLGSLFV